MWGVKNKLSEEMAQVCSQDFCYDDVKKEIMKMHPLKASGPDSIPILFLQKY